MHNSKTSNWFVGKKDILKDFSLYLAGSVITMLLSLIINPLISKTMSHSDFAIVGYFTSFSALIMPIISFSLVSYYSRHFYLCNDEKREKMKNTLLIALLFFSSLLSVIIFFVFYLYATVVKISFPIFPYALLQILSVYLNCFLVFMQVDLRMRKNAQKYFYLTLFSGLIIFFATLLLVVVLKYGATGKLLAPVIGYFCTLVYCLKFFISDWKFDKTLFKDVLKFSSPLVLAGMFAYFYSGIDMFFLEKKGDTVNMALYSIGLMISGYLMIFGNSFAQTFQADFFQAISNKKWKVITKLTLITVAVNAIPVILFILLAPYIINILTAGRYNDSTQYAQLLCLRIIPFFVYFCFENVIIGLGYSKGLLFVKVFGLMVIVILYYFLIKNFNFYGAAWGQILSYSVLTLISISFLLYTNSEKIKYHLKNGK